MKTEISVLKADMRVQVCARLYKCALAGACVCMCVEDIGQPLVSLLSFCLLHI